jgi:two-component system, NarL family, sensor kinase
VARPVQQFVDYFAAEPVRVSAILRLPLIGLIAVLVWIWEPALTAIIGTVTAVGYLAVWIFYSERDDKVGWPNMVYTHFGFLLWLAVAVTALCYVLARRSARVKALQEMRRQLVSEAMQSDERHNREVAEHLHDGPLQTPLAARLELDEARERNPAVRELLRQFESRTDLAVQADLEDVGKPESQALLYRAARELLTNIGKHAKATTVRVGLMRNGDRIVLTIDDDGTGFDSAIVAQYVADGHIGLGSLLARFDAMGGAMDINSQIGYGTQVTVTSPPEPVAYSGELGAPPRVQGGT